MEGQGRPTVRICRQIPSHPCTKVDKQPSSDQRMPYAVAEALAWSFLFKQQGMIPNKVLAATHGAGDSSLL